MKDELRPEASDSQFHTSQSEHRDVPLHARHKRYSRPPELEEAAFSVVRDVASSRIDHAQKVADAFAMKRLR